MNLQDIARNYPKFQRCPVEGWSSPLENVMEALFSTLIKPDYTFYFADLLDRSRLEVYALFDIYHGPNDTCALYVLVVDNKPVGVAFKFGDKTQWDTRIIDADHFKGIVRELSAILLERQLESVTAEDVEELRFLNNGFLCFLDEKETMFGIHSPKSVGRFDQLTEKHRAFFVDTEGKAHLVSSIGQFCNTKPSHCWDEDTNDVVITVNGAERTVDGQLLMFELVPGEGDIEAAVARYAKEPAWVVEAVHERVKRVELLAQFTNRWNSSSVWFDFKSKEELQRFANEYFDHEKEKLVKAPVCLKTLGFDATLHAIHH
jgi:hypothetical protein